MRTVAIALGFLVVSGTASAAVLHVPTDYATISLAIASAQSGDEILVAAGTYQERISLDATKDGVKIHSESGPAVTILDGGLAGAVVTMSSVGSGTELIGFTIKRGGTATGGGVRLSQASPKIENNVITGNFSYGGAGISAIGGSPLILNNEISGNQTLNGPGGGIYLSGGTPDIENNSIHGNSAAGKNRGGGIYSDGFAGIVRANQIFSNASEEGGGMFMLDGKSSSIIRENEFRSNTATNYGGGVFLNSGGTFESNKIIGNVSGVEGGGLYLGNITLRGDLIQDNTSPMGGGVFMNLGSVVFDHVLILRNHGGTQGGGVSALGGTATFRNCTIALNSASSGGGNVHFRSQSNLTLVNSIVAFSPDGGIVSDASVGAPGFAWITCSDVSNNAGGDYVGLSAPPSDNRVISLDPLFCDLASLDLHLGSSSPCASPNGCLQMGALPVSCQPVATEPSTWGKLKARYR